MGSEAIDHKSLILQQEKEIQELRQNLEIEAALERVRSKAMAMQNSSDLPHVALTLVNELTSLGIKHLGISIIIVKDKVSVKYDQFSALEKLDGNGIYLDRVENLDGTSLMIGREIFSRIENQETDFSILLQGKAFTEFMVHTRDNIDHERGSAMLKSEIDTIHFQVAVFHDYSNIIISTFDPLPESDRVILRRMANTFGQCYMRYLDLQKAEAQARQAQIEAALERVRAASMAMQHSSELPSVALTLVDQLKTLNIDEIGTSITIVDKEKETFTSYAADQDLKTGEKLVIQQPEVDLDSIWLARESYKRAENGEANFTLIAKGKHLEEFINHTVEQVGTDRGLKNTELDCLYFHFFKFFEKNSIICCTKDQMDNEDQSVLIRMAETFGQSYRRFLDLQKAEAQSREAQVEAALERVRASTMAMHSSENVGKCIVKMFDVITALGVDVDTRFGIGILDHKTQNNELWTVSKAGEEIQLHIGNIDMTWHPLLRSARKTWKAQKPLHQYVLEGEDLLEYYRMLNDAPDYPLHIAIENLPDKQYHYGFVFEHGFFYAFSLSELESDLIRIIQRFTSVFAQTYRRYLDLVKAEAQAREAQIQSILERVSSRSMAMQKSEELKEVVNHLFSGLEQLDYNPIDCTILTLDVELGKIECWSTVPTKDGFSAYTYALKVPEESFMKKISQAYREQKPSWIYHLKGEEKKSFDNAFFEAVHIPEMEAALRSIEALYANFVFMPQSAIAVFSGEPMEGADIALLQRFSKVVNLCYTRFIDLKKAESQAREAQIEAALERVRAITMAMHHSSNLFDAAGVMFNQIRDLGANLFSCGFAICKENTSVVEQWMYALPVDEFKIHKLDHEKEHFHSIMYKSWKSQKSYYEGWVRGKEMESMIEFLMTNPNIQKNIAFLKEAGIEFPKEQKLHAATFSKGYLLFITTEDFAESEIFVRFAKVFEQTYTRFLDLKKVEAQAREAQIEAALERVRSRSMAMQSSEELADVCQVMITQVRELSINSDSVSIGIFDEQKHIYEIWISVLSELTPTSFKIPYLEHPDFKDIHDAWRSGRSSFSQTLKKKELENHLQFLINNGMPAHDLLAKSQVENITHCVDHMFFKYGAIDAISPVENLNEENKTILKRFASVFEQTYTRFLDLQKAEMQARLIREERDRLNETLRELQTTQAQLIHSEKMASLGELTAGIAHEIQNPLNFVNNFSEVGSELIEEIEEEIENNDLETVKELLNELIENLKKIHHHGERASGIVRGMLDHSRASSDEKTLTDINQLCDEYLRLAYHGLRAKNKSFQANFQLDADPDLPKVLVASQDMGRVLLNLINNGFQAILEKSKKSGKDYKPELLVKTLHAGNSIQIQVKDNGSGIPTEIQEKIFQPFFTTKPTGQGTGLGLSLAYDIMNAHGGKIDVNSTKVEGTIFTITLPIDRITLSQPLTKDQE